MKAAAKPQNGGKTLLRILSYLSRNRVQLVLVSPAGYSFQRRTGSRQLFSEANH